MSDMYRVTSGKLKLKGHKSHKKHKSKHKDETRDEDAPVRRKDDDADDHGGWWCVSDISDIVGAVAIELSPNCYMLAQDNGLFSIGPPHNQGEGPSQEEILTAIKIDDSKIALKSGYGKYLSVASDEKVIGRSDAIGSKENWEPIFQDNKIALLGCNQKFVSVDEEDSVMASSSKVSINEVIKIRSNSDRDEIDPSKLGPEEERGNIKQIEENYV